MAIHLIFLFFRLVYSSWDDSSLADGYLGGYFNMTEITKMLNSLVSSSVTLVTAGQTVGGVDITGVQVTSSGKPYIDGLDTSKRQNILVTGTHTTTQPLSASQVLYLLNYMLNDENSDTLYLLKTSTFYFFPVINVDAYTKSYENYATSSSFTTYLKNTESTCTSDSTKSGVDLGRNFEAYWHYDEVGSSGDACSDTYRGTAAFSEKESSAIKTLIVDKNLKMWIHYDNYGNQYLYPYSYTTEDMLKAYSGHEQYYSYYQNLPSNATSLKSMTYGTYYALTKGVVNGAIIDYGMNKSVISFQAAIGDKSTAKDAILTTCRTHTATFKEIAMTSTPSVKLYLDSSLKVECESGKNCGDAQSPDSFSTLQFTLQNQGLSDSYDTLILTFKATYGTTYDYMLANITSGSSAVTYTNVTDSAQKISLQVTITSLAKLTNYTFNVNLYSYKGASYNDEDMTITYSAAVASSLSSTKTYLTYGDTSLSGTTTPTIQSSTNNGSGAFTYIRVSSSHHELAAVAVISIFMGIFMIVIWVFLILKFKKEKQFGSHEDHEPVSHGEISIKIDEKDTKNVTSDNITGKNEFPARPGDDFKGFGGRNLNGFEVNNVNKEPKKFEFKSEARLPEGEGSPGLKGRFGVSNPQPEIRGNFGGYRGEVPEKQSPRIENVGFRGNIGGRAVEIPEKQSPRENPGFGRPDMRPGFQKTDIEMARPEVRSQDQTVNVPLMRQGLPPKPEPELKGNVNIPSGFTAIQVESDAPKGKFNPAGREIPSHLKASPFGKEPQAKLTVIEEPQLPGFARQPTEPGVKNPIEKQSLAPVFEVDEPRQRFGDPQARIGGGIGVRYGDEPKPQFASPQFKGSMGAEIQQRPPGAGINLAGPPVKNSFQPISAAFRADEGSDDIQILAEENRWGEPPARKINLNSSSSSESF